MQRYQTTTWARIRADKKDMDRPFAKHLREISRERQIAFVRLMNATGGNPTGFECRSKNQHQWAFVIEDVAGESPYRIQTFDRDGFIGHSCHRTFQDAVEDMLGRGYTVMDQGALDRCAGTLRWSLGVKRMEIRQLFDQGVIDFREMLDRMQPFAYIEAA